MGTPDLAAQDPGRALRRMARIGTAVFLLSMIKPLGCWELPAGFRGLMYTSLFSGLSVLLVCDPRVLRPGAPRLHILSILVVAILATTVAAYMTLYRMARASGGSPPFWIASLYQFFAALAILEGWRQRRTAFCAFWPGTFHVVMACTTCVAMFFWALSSRPSDPLRLTAFSKLSPDALVFGTFCFIFICVGWHTWWRTIQRTLGTQETAADQGGG